MTRVWIMLALVGLALWAAHPVNAQDRLAIFEGTVLNPDGSPGEGRLVVVFLNSKELGRSPTVCDGQICRFEIVVPDEHGVAQPGPDGVGVISVPQLKVGSPRAFQPPDQQPGQRATYAVVALIQPAAELPDLAHSGRLGLMPDGGVVIIEDSRPPTFSRPAPSQAAQPAPLAPAAAGFPFLAVGLLAITCCGSLAALGGLALFIFLGRRTA